jgi:hypothetical protein
MLFISTINKIAPLSHCSITYLRLNIFPTG